MWRTRPWMDAGKEPLVVRINGIARRNLFVGIAAGFAAMVMLLAVRGEF